MKYKKAAMLKTLLLSMIHDYKLVTNYLINVIRLAFTLLSYDLKLKFS